MTLGLAATGKRRTFGQRLKSAALWWGIPMLALELIGVPIKYWLWVLIFTLPSIALGVFVVGVLESGLIALVRNRNRQ